MEEFGSKSFWRAYRACASRLLGPEPGADVCLAVETVDERGIPVGVGSFGLTFVDGRLVEVGRDTQTSPDLVLRVPLTAIESLIGESKLSHENASRIQISKPEGLDCWTRLPPFDEHCVPEFNELAAINGASAKVRLDLKSSPFGLLTYFTTFVDGKREPSRSSTP